MPDPPRSDPPRDSETLRTLDLVDRAQHGDLAAWEQLFERYYPVVRAIARRRLGRALRRSVDSGDIVNEAMVHALRSFGDFEIRERKVFVGWLARIVENRIRRVARDHHQREDPITRRIAGHLRATVSRVRGGLEQPSPSPTPSEALVAEESSERLHGALGKLAPAQREVIRLRDFERLEWSVIADRLESPSPNAARMLYARALVELSRRLGRER